MLIIISHYPITMYSNVRGMKDLFWGTDREISKWYFRIAPGVLIAFCTILACFLTSIDCVIDFTSSIAGGSMAFIFPGLYLSKTSDWLSKRNIND